MLKTGDVININCGMNINVNVKGYMVKDYDGIDPELIPPTVKIKVNDTTNSILHGLYVVHKIITSNGYQVFCEKINDVGIKINFNLFSECSHIQNISPIGNILML